MDLGCGTATHAYRCRQEGFSTVAVDKEELNLEYELPWQDEEFDTVLLLDVLEHLDHDEECLQEVWRILRPSGRLLLSVPRQDHRRGLLDPDHRREYHAGALSSLIDRTKWKVLYWGLSVRWTRIDGLMDFLGACWFPLYRKWATWKHRTATDCNTTGFRLVLEKLPPALLVDPAWPWSIN